MLTAEDKKTITVKLSIFNKKPVLSNIRIVSRPGLRIYMSVDEIESYNKPDILLRNLNFAHNIFLQKF